MTIEEQRIHAAWSGRISGCQLGKPVELLSMRGGLGGLRRYLEEAQALPLRDYVPLIEGTLVAEVGRASCRGELCRSEPDDDINYTVLALMMLEAHGSALTTTDVARCWLKHLPIAMTFTAERAAFVTLVQRAHEYFAHGMEPGFDLAECSDNAYNDWIGAQIRSDLYGWVCPGDPARAADLARRDAQLSHRGEGVHGAAFVAALGAAIPGCDRLADAIRAALAEIPAHSDCAAAVALAVQLAGSSDAVDRLHEHYRGMSPVHTVNNLALVVWALLSGEDDYSVAVGEAVTAGWDTDCNGATVGGLWGLQGKPLPAHWTDPWQRRVAVNLAGVGELSLDSLVERTLAVGRALA
jgi:ADP-ribosylglycohydrolase